MKKEEFEKRFTEAEALCKKGNFSDAVSIFDELNLNHVNQPKRLQEVARAYERCKRLEDAEDVLLLAKDLAPKSRAILFRLCSISIKSKKMEDAKDYYNQFISVAANDAQRFVLQYRLAEAKNAPIEERIQILEAFKNEEPEDKWMLELASLYVSADRKEDAIELCKDIVLWFNEGKYVEAAQNVLTKYGVNSEKKQEEIEESADTIQEEKPSEVQSEDMTFTFDVGEKVIEPEKEEVMSAEEPVAEEVVQEEKPAEEDKPEHVVVQVTTPVEIKEEPEKLAQEEVEEKTEEPEVLPEKRTTEDAPRELQFIEEENFSLGQEIKQKKEKEKNQFFNVPFEPIVSVDTWHFLVVGNSDNLTVECAKEILRQVVAENTNCPKKVLKINAEKIGKANIINSLDRFLGNMVIIQHASLLSEQQLQDFAKVLDREDHSLLVVFTDTSEAMKRILEKVPALRQSFTGVFEGKAYQPEDLVQFMKEWLYTEDARMSKDAEQYALDYADYLIDQGNSSCRNGMHEFAIKALNAAEKGGFLKMAAGKVDDDGFLVLTEKHLRKAEKQK